MLTKEEFIEKNKVIDDALVILKKEFVGIHKQIDSIMKIVRTWYLYPELQSRPVVVNIWGLSGTGKTQLIKRISQLLGVDKDTIYFNFASISESTSWEIENEIEEYVLNNNPNRIIVYDEFQYANTLDPIDGHEADKKTALKPFWELLDNGVIKKKNDIYNTSRLVTLSSYIAKISTIHEVKIENGIWVNAKDCFNGCEPYIVTQFNRYFNFDLCGEDKKNKPLKRQFDFADSDFFLTDTSLSLIITQYQRHIDMSLQDIDIYMKIKNMDANEFINFVLDLSDMTKRGYEIPFNESIIFIIGNLDEAYQISFDVNPDMSPDQFRAITEDMSVVDIKKALQKRFRNEQIARMGNIHIIYPSFSKKNFEDIIEMQLDAFKEDVKKLTGYNITFDQTINDIIYKEGVFPTHGTRPVFSTVHEIVKTPLSRIIFMITESNNADTDMIKCAFNIDKECVSVTLYDKNGNELDSFDVDTTIRLENIRKDKSTSEEQSICAVHESGHFVVYTSLFGKLPEKLVSKTVDSECGGFLMENYNDSKKKVSRSDYMKEIQVLLAGFVAEKFVFGLNEYTSGASSDLRMASILASKMIRNLGMGNAHNSNPCVTTKAIGQTNLDGEALIPRDDSDRVNNEIKNVIYEAQQKVYQILQSKDWYPMFKESVKYLNENQNMPNRVMKELYDKVSEDAKKSPRSSTYYQDCINKL